MVTAHGRLIQTLGSRMASTGCRRTGCHSEASDLPGFCSWCPWFLLIGAQQVGYAPCARSAGWRNESRQWTELERMGRRCRSGQSRNNLTYPLRNLQQSDKGFRGPPPFLLPLCAPLYRPQPLWPRPGCLALSGNWVCDLTEGWKEMESRDSHRGSSGERREGTEQDQKVWRERGREKV